MLRRGLITKREEFHPIRVVGLELTDPPIDLRGLDRYSHVRALVRLQGTPLGWVQVPVTTGRCTHNTLVQSAFARYTAEIRREFVRRALEEPLTSSKLTLPRKPKRPVAAPTVSWPLVTVAVCTRDRPNYLESCVKSLLKLSYPKLELLVVDNAPATVASEKLLRECFPTVRYVREPRPGLNWARNRAIADARGEIMAYTDDDVVVDPSWVDALVCVFTAAPSVAAITGLVASLELETYAQAAFEDHRGYDNEYWFLREWFRACSAGGQRASRRHGNAGIFGSGANMAFRTGVLRRIGGFDPALDVGTFTQGGGDLEMFFRILKEGYTLVREPRAVVHHRNRRCYSELRAQLETWGIGMHAYLIRSWEAYPDERMPLLWLYLRWLLLRNLRRLACSLFSERLCAELVWSEMRRSLMAPLRYREARRTVKRLEEQFGPLSLTNDESVTKPRRCTRRGVPQSAVLRRIELNSPIEGFDELEGVSRIQVEITWNGRIVGSLTLHNVDQPVPALWLRDEIARQLAVRVLELAGMESADLRDILLCRREERCE